jgi:predicted nucleotidyltransferase
MDVVVPFDRWPDRPWLSTRTLFLTVHGSRSYGLNRSTSDVDVKGIAVPPREVMHGFVQSFEQAELRDPIDCVVYDLRKFCRLAAEGNPNIIEILFTDPRYWIRTTPQHQRLCEVRQLFLSRKVRHTFAGYANAQLKRISGHYRWMRTPPTHPPTRDEFGLPSGPTLPKDQRDLLQGLIKARLESWRLDLEPLDPASRIQFEARMEEVLLEIGAATPEALYDRAGRSLGIGDSLMEVLRAERAYRSRREEWEAFQQWKRNRNPARHELEVRFGYDTKHAMHLVRLLRMAREILTTGQVHVERADREELLAIRDGAWSYEDLVAWAEQQNAELEAVCPTSPLPKEPDLAVLDQVCCEIMQSLL